MSVKLVCENCGGEVITGWCNECMEADERERDELFADRRRLNWVLAHPTAQITQNEKDEYAVYIWPVAHFGFFKTPRAALDDAIKLTL